MTPALRKVGLAIAAIALGCSAFVLAARGGWLKPYVADMRAHYGLPTSRYIDLQGQALHYVDEGHGPAIVLVHGSYANLRQWDVWAKALASEFRIIRFDRPFMGLSGPSPGGRSDGESEALLIAALAEHLKLDRFALVATSSAGEGVAHFAAKQPEKVSALVLANVAAGPIAFAPGSYPLWFRAVLAIDPLFNGWHPQLFWRGVLEQNFADEQLIKPALVREWTELNNLAQGSVRKPRPEGKLPFAGTPVDLATIRAPTLLLWSDQDHEVPVATHGNDAFRLLTTPDKTLIIISDCGHLMPIECGEESSQHAARFFRRVMSPNGG